MTECYGVYDSPHDVEFSTYSTKVVVKCNHVSGVNIFYSPGSVLPNWYFRKFSSALNSNYYLASREWNYKSIRPKILVEEFLESSDPLMDYRFLCFDGTVKAVFIDKDTAQDSGLHNPDAVRKVYDPEFNLLPIKVGRNNYDATDLIKPDRWADIIAIAETLSKRFPFCRVDLYNIDGRIVFGEMTFYPGGCCQNVEPQEWDVKFGSYIDLNSKNIVLKRTSEM